MQKILQVSIIVNGSVNSHPKKETKSITETLLVPFMNSSDGNMTIVRDAGHTFFKHSAFIKQNGPAIMHLPLSLQ